MKLRLKQGGIVKLQNAAETIPTVMVTDPMSQRISQNNHLTQIMERDAAKAEWERKVEAAEKKADERINNEDNNLASQFMFSGETGEGSRGANTNARRAQYVAEELGLDGNKAFLDSYKKDGKTGAIAFGTTLLTAPMAGEFATYGLLGGAARLAGGMAGSAVGSGGLGKVGDWADNRLGTNGMGTTGRIVGGFAGGGPGSNIAYKGALDLASKAPSIARIGATDRFIGDVAGRALGRSVNSTSFIPAQVKYYGTQYPETTRLYRITGTSGNFTPSPDGTAEFAGQGFSSDPTKGLLYGSRTAKEARKLGIENPIELQVVDIPNSQLEHYRASNILKGRTDVEYELTEDFLIPLDMPRGRAPMNFTGNALLDNKLELPNIPTKVKDHDSIIEGSKSISFAPTPQRFVSTVYFDPRVIPLSRPISEAERLGIPKGIRSNPKALEDPQYGGYQQGNQRYFDALYRGDYPEVQRIRDLHFKIKAPDTKVVDEKGMPIHMYHGIADRSNGKRFQQYRGVNGNVERAVKAGDKRSHGKISEPNTDVMANYHTPNYKIAAGSYGRGKQDLVYDDYLNIKKPITGGEDIHNLLNSEYPGYSRKILHTIPAHNNMITGELIPARQFVTYTGVSDGSRFNGPERKILMKQGYDGLFIPQYYDSYGAFVSPSQFKSADPITYNGFGEIIPIVKRDNFYNLDRRYKQGGNLKIKFSSHENN